MQATVWASGYASTYYCDGGGRVYVVDAARWTMRLVNVAKQELLDPVPMPVQARALILDPGTATLWAGDGAQGRIVKLEPGAAAPQSVAPIACPMGIAVFTVE